MLLPPLVLPAQTRYHSEVGKELRHSVLARRGRHGASRSLFARLGAGSPSSGIGYRMQGEVRWVKGSDMLCTCQSHMFGQNRIDRCYLDR